MIRDYIEKLPLKANKKLELFNFLRRLEWQFKYPRDLRNSLLSTQTYIPSNSFYGHEYWLKRYSGCDDNIYGLIEHGLYFGENRDKVGFHTEWDMGSIITYGEYRAILLNELYPDYNIIKIGPRIHYAKTDENYLKELKSKIDVSKKTMTVFPSHSLAEEQAYYNIDVFYEELIGIAKDLNVGNVLISLHPSDFLHGIDKVFEQRGMTVVSSGKDSIKFLPRQRAIFEVSDITYSNAIGTHVGYSLYMNKPHIINTKSLQSQQPKEDDVLASTYYKEEKMFESVFNGENPYSITKEQKELYDYYWGGDCIRTPEELNKELDKCKETFTKKFL